MAITTIMPNEVIGGTRKIAIKALTSQTIYDIIKQRSEQAKIDTVRPHDLRRTFVTQLLEAGVDINTAPFIQLPKL